MARRLKKRISTGRIGITHDPRARIGKTDLRPSDIDAIQARCLLPPAPQSTLPGGLDHEPFIPPCLIGGEVEFPQKDSTGESRNDFQKIVITDRGPKLVPLQRATKPEKCVIDYLSFTVSEEILHRIEPDKRPFSDEDYCEAWGDYCAKALLKLSAPLHWMRGGIFGYDCAARLGDYGLIASGGKTGTLYVQFSGHAFAVADSDFPRRLNAFLVASNTANLTRLDIAFDDLDGSMFPVRSVPKMWEDGGFTQARSPRAPRFETRGDWRADDPEQRGLTAYIGSRQSGKYVRIYEKGRALGDKSSPWVRVEVELRGDVFALVPAMLIHPTSFFVMVAPVFASIEYAFEINKLERIAREGFATVEKLLEIIKHQYGGHLHVLRKEFFNWSDTELLDRITREPALVAPALRRAINLSNALETADPETCVQTGEIQES